MTDLLPPDATCACVLTPAGRGAVAVVQVAGPRAVAAVDACFLAANRRALAAQPMGALRFGRWLGESGEEVVVCVRAGPDARPVVEVHCHGGRAAVGAILNSLKGHGCAEASWESVLQESAASCLVAEAELALRCALTERAAAVLLDQAEGALDAAVRRALEAQSPRLAVAELDKALRWSELGARLTRPWRVVLAGAPNVGKSSLINAIVGYTRAIVFEHPGTTRDVVTAEAAIDGWPVALADTAGVRETSDPTEAAGVRLAREALRRADLALEVRDASDASGAPSVLGDAPVVRRVEVLNKIDLAPEAARRAGGGSGRVATCAVSGEGVVELLETISRQLVPEPPPAGAAVPISERQVAALARARGLWEKGDDDDACSALESLLAPPAPDRFHP